MMHALLWLTGIIAAALGATYALFRKGGAYNPEKIEMDYTKDNVASFDTEGHPEYPMPSSIPAPQAPTALPSPFKPMILKWATAIGHWEGAKPESNNPGNLKISSLTSSWGATKGRPAADGGFFCQFKTPQAGRDALCNFLTLGAEYQLIISHPKPCTIRQFTVKFAGNPPQGYIQGICKELGISTDTEIGTLLS